MEVVFTPDVVRQLLADGLDVKYIIMLRYITMKDGKLRSNRPVLPRKATENGTKYANDEERELAHACILWRYLVMYLSPNEKHHAIPSSYIHWLDEPHEQRINIIREMEQAAEFILYAFPEELWHGVNAYGGTIWTIDQK